MASYLIANYDITNPDDYPAYVAAVGATLQGVGAEVLVADYNSEVVEGKLAKISVVIRFASKAAAMEWYNSPAYQAIVHLRTSNSTGSMVLVDGYVMPT